MNSGTFVTDLGVLRFEQDMVNLGMDETGKPDPNWVFIDGAGHEHRYVQTEDQADDNYPTLKWEESERYYCETCNDEHVDFWQVCAQCAEVIKPGWTRPTYMPITIPGTIRYTLDDEPITHERANELIQEWQKTLAVEEKERATERQQRIVGGKS